MASVGDSGKKNKVKHKTISNTEKLPKREIAGLQGGEHVCIGMKGVYFL